MTAKRATGRGSDELRHPAKRNLSSWYTPLSTVLGVTWSARVYWNVIADR